LADVIGPSLFAFGSGPDPGLAVSEANSCTSKSLFLMRARI
jgi:hypothetical protein